MSIDDDNTYYIFEDDFQPFMVDILRYLCEKYAARCIGEILVGRNRNVFKLSSRVVVKIPTCLDGFADNDWEGSLSNDGEYEFDNGYVQYARTRLCYYKDVPIVFMEYISYAGEEEITTRMGYEPEWVMSVDSGQVGFNRLGHLVAFDYGCR